MLRQYFQNTLEAVRGNEQYPRQIKLLETALAALNQKGSMVLLQVTTALDFQSDCPEALKLRTALDQELERIVRRLSHDLPSWLKV